MIRVLITEDSAVVTEILKKILDSDPEIEVIGRARNGQEGVELTAKLRPDVVTMDIRMPVMDGLAATKQIMRETPTPILVISASANKEDLGVSFDAINAGALDVMEKPRADSSMRYGEMGEELVRRVKIVSRVRPLRRISMPAPVARSPQLALAPVRSMNRVLAIGASTGGPQALLTIFKELPANFPFPILVVQHISRGFIHGFVDWINHDCAVKAMVARNGDRLKAGAAFFPSDDCHLGLQENGEIVLSHGGSVNGHRPSIDFLMRTVAGVFGKESVGILLTGMGRDGVEGMRAIKRAGGTTIAQNQSSSVVFGMPKEAINAGVVDKVVGLDDLAAEILSLAQ